MEQLAALDEMGIRTRVSDLAGKDDMMMQQKFPGMLFDHSGKYDKLVKAAVEAAKRKTAAS